MFCMKCGAKLPSDARFCYKCGTGVYTEDVKEEKTDAAEEDWGNFLEECDDEPIAENDMAEEDAFPFRSECYVPFDNWLEHVDLKNELHRYSYYDETIYGIGRDNHIIKVKEDGTLSRIHMKKECSTGDELFVNQQGILIKRGTSFDYYVHDGKYIHSFSVAKKDNEELLSYYIYDSKLYMIAKKQLSSGEQYSITECDFCTKELRKILDFESYKQKICDGLADGMRQAFEQYCKEGGKTPVKIGGWKYLGRPLNIFANGRRIILPMEFIAKGSLNGNVRNPGDYAFDFIDSYECILSIDVETLKIQVLQESRYECHLQGYKRGPRCDCDDATWIRYFDMLHDAMWYADDSRPGILFKTDIKPIDNVTGAYEQWIIDESVDRLIQDGSYGNLYFDGETMYRNDQQHFYSFNSEGEMHKWKQGSNGELGNAPQNFLSVGKWFAIRTYSYGGYDSWTFYPHGYEPAEKSKWLAVERELKQREWI